MSERRLSPLYVDPIMPRWWDRSVIALTVASLGLLAFDMGLRDPASELSRTLGWIDLGFCALFVVDFAARLRRATDKWQFVRRNGWDLLGSIPLVGPLRAARVIRLLRLVRLTRVASLAKRLARQYDVPVPGRALAALTAATLAIWGAAGGLFFWFEHGVNDGIQGIDDALWWSITTLSTVGYGDLYPESQGGRIVAVSTMILGVGVLGTLAATLATALIEARERGRRGARSYMLKDHVLVLGWNAKSLVAIDEFRLDARYRDTPICVVADLEVTPVDDDTVRFVRGSPAHGEPLGRASVERAAAAMVFARDPTDPRSDHETAVVVHAFRRRNARARLCAELVDSANREVLADAGCDSIVDLRSVISSLMTRSVSDAGVCDVITDLLSNRGGSELYRIVVSSELVGRSWRECAHALLERGSTAIGLLRDGAIRMSPALDERLAAGDEVFVVSREPPEQA